MFGLKIFVRVQTFRRGPPVLPYNFCNPVRWITPWILSFQISCVTANITIYRRPLVKYDIRRKWFQQKWFLERNNVKSYILCKSIWDKEFSYFGITPWVLIFWISCYTKYCTSQRKHCQRHNRPKALSTLTKLATFGLSRSFNKVWSFCQWEPNSTVTCQGHMNQVLPTLLGDSGIESRQ